MLAVMSRIYIDDGNLLTVPHIIPQATRGTWKRGLWVWEVQWSSRDDHADEPYSGRKRSILGGDIVNRILCERLYTPIPTF